MQRDTRSNSTGPDIPPTPPRTIRNRNADIMAQGTPPTAGAPLVLAAQPAKVETWTMNPMTENFNPGNIRSQALQQENKRLISRRLSHFDGCKPEDNHEPIQGQGANIRISDHFNSDGLRCPWCWNRKKEFDFPRSELDFEGPPTCFA